MAKTMLISKKMLEGANNPPFVQDALKMIEAGDFVAARGKLEAGIADKNARPIEAMLALASAYWDDPDQRARDPKKSIEYLKEAIDLSPKDARPYALLGRYLLAKGLRDQALNFLDRAIQLDPDNADARRLRDRASLQKKKQYTVVAKASDFTEQKSKKKGAGVGKAEGFKKQATRLLKLEDVSGAAAELEKAKVGAGAEIDVALSALLGAELVKADQKLLESKGSRGRGVAILRTLIAFVVIGIVGLALGGLVSRVMPEAKGSPEEQLVQKLRADRASTLDQVLSESLDLEGDAAGSALALANALLTFEHGADEDHLKNAEEAIKNLDAKGRQLPLALLARALLTQWELADGDPELKNDLERAVAAEGTRDDPWILQAAALRAPERDVRIRLLSRAAFVEDPPLRALHELAREHAAQGEADLAIDLIERIWKKEPAHGRSLATAVLLAATSGENAKSKETETEKRVLKIFDDTEVPAVDLVPAALALTAVADARENNEIAGPMRERAEDTETLSSFPGLMSNFAHLTMLEVADFTETRALLESGIDRFPNEVVLRIDLTRAKVLASLPDQRVRQLRAGANPKIDGKRLVLPLGNFAVNFSANPLPWRPNFDSRFFPEEAISGAMAIKGLTAAAAERRLAVVANIKLAEVALGGGDLETATKYVERALEESPTNPEVHLTRALIAARNNQRAAARDSIEEARRVAPDDPRILLAAARMQLAAGDTRAAKKALARLDDEGYLSPTALVVAAELALTRGDLDAAEKSLQKTRAFGAEQDTQVLAAHVKVAGAKGDVAAGVRAVKKLRKTTSDFARITDSSKVVRAFALRVSAEEDKEDALTKLDPLTRDKATKSLARMLVADIEAASGNKEKAAEILVSVIEDGAGPVVAGAKEQLAILKGEARPDDRRRRRRRRRGR